MSYFVRSFENPYYSCWQNIKQRCLNENHPAYGHYGGRGITLWQGWLDDFTSFVCYVLDELGERPEGMSLDRINNDGNYEPGNLRWATQSVQNGNKRKAKSAHSYLKPNNPVSKTGFRWVRKIISKGNTYYYGVMKVAGKRVYCGNFYTPEEAHQAAVNKRIELGLPLE